MGDEGDREGGGENEPYGEQHYRPEVGAQVERRGGDGRRVQQWRQKDEEDCLRRDLDVGQSRHKADTQAAQNQEDRVGHAEHPGQLREKRRGPEQEDEGLYLVHLPLVRVPACRSWRSSKSRGSRTPSSLRSRLRSLLGTPTFLLVARLSCKQHSGKAGAPY
jgi:hypothetical protein